MSGLGGEVDRSLIDAGQSKMDKGNLLARGGGGCTHDWLLLSLTLPEGQTTSHSINHMNLIELTHGSPLYKAAKQ